MESKNCFFALALLLLLSSVQSVRGGIYLNVTDTGAFELTNRPADESFRLIAGSSSRRRMDETQRAVELASGIHDLPESLIFAIIKHKQHERGGVMGLSPAFRSDLTDTQVHEVESNVTRGAGHLKQLLSHFHGNLTLALGAFYTGKKAVDQAGGLPGSTVRQFVIDVRDSFGKIDKREEIFYTYQNSDGVLTVVNISPS